MSSQGRRRVSVGGTSVACVLVALAVHSVRGPCLAQDAASAPNIVQGAVPDGRLPDVFPSPQAEIQGAEGGCPSPQHQSSELSVPITSINQLFLLDDSQLQFLYQSAGGATIPVGKIRGKVILFPGSRMARPASKVARLMWQGKIFHEDGTTAVNRFFGLRMIKAKVYQGKSWVDGGPSLILDYKTTSWVYRRYRDEIREVGPGIYLGQMYARTQPEPTFKMFFALDVTH